ncbi:rRNA-processing protein cgr1 [Serendipita sp. 396]|nr:rRNA-processing protein cgr1 [Serendipita sp. 396]KAG8870780.1 rRNA-processing protein cgr1 [Serendipita sp. 405]
MQSQSPGQLNAVGVSKTGRVSGKNWKTQKTATVRSNLPNGVKSRSWEDRKRKDTQLAAVKALQKELQDEKKAEIQRRREITQERKERALERQRLEEMKAKMSAKKLARMRKRQGRTKKING